MFSINRYSEFNGKSTAKNEMAKRKTLCNQRYRMIDRFEIIVNFYIFIFLIFNSNHLLLISLYKLNRNNTTMIHNNGNHIHRSFQRLHVFFLNLVCSLCYSQFAIIMNRTNSWRLWKKIYLIKIHFIGVSLLN